MQFKMSERKAIIDKSIRTPRKQVQARAAHFDPKSSNLRFVVPTQGHAIRTVITGTKSISSAAYISRKNRMSFGTEGETEFLDIMRDEVVVSTLRSRVQPFRSELMTGAGIICHIPDKARQLADGSWQIVDIKREWKQFRTPEGEQQTMLGQMAADELGAEYIRIVHASLGTEKFLENVDLIQSYRFVNVTLRQKYLAAELLAGDGRMPLGRLADLLDPSAANGFALVCSMMVQRMLEIDLSSPVDRHSALTAVPPAPAYLPDLFASLRVKAPLAA